MLRERKWHSKCILNPSHFCFTLKSLVGSGAPSVRELAAPWVQYLGFPPGDRCRGLEGVRLNRATLSRTGDRVSTVQVGSYRAATSQPWRPVSGLELAKLAGLAPHREAPIRHRAPLLLLPQPQPRLLAASAPATGCPSPDAGSSSPGSWLPQPGCCLRPEQAEP